MLGFIKKKSQKEENRQETFGRRLQDYAIAPMIVATGMGIATGDLATGILFGSLAAITAYKGIVYSTAMAAIAASVSVGGGIVDWPDYMPMSAGYAASLTGIAATFGVAARIAIKLTSSRQGSSRNLNEVPIVVSSCLGAIGALYTFSEERMNIPQEVENVFLQGIRGTSMAFVTANAPPAACIAAGGAVMGGIIGEVVIKCAAPVYTCYRQLRLYQRAKATTSIPSSHYDKSKFYRV